MAQIKLSPEQEHVMRDMDATIADLHQELNKAESAGLNVDELRKALVEADTLRQNLIKVYGANSRIGY
jgi:hypothetical protein